MRLSPIVSITFFLSLICIANVYAVVEPFHYYYTDPYAGDAQKYIVINRLENAELYTEGTFTYWKPAFGDSTKASTTPGTIIYHFPFDGTIKGGFLNMNASCFHWWYSQGHAYLYASSDGQNWTQLVEAVHPGLASYNGPIPAEFLHKNNLYLKAELFSFGERANVGGIWTNTAQHSRYQNGSDIRTFELRVEFDEWIIGITSVSTKYIDNNGKEIIFDGLVPGKSGNVTVKIKNPKNEIVSSRLRFGLSVLGGEIKDIGEGDHALRTGGSYYHYYTEVQTPLDVKGAYEGQLVTVLEDANTEELMDKHVETVIIKSWKNNGLPWAYNLLLIGNEDEGY